MRDAALHLSMSAPLDVELDITSKCQLDCSYCSAAPLMGSEITTERAVQLIDEMGRLGVFSLLISGGEPTIHPGILEVLAAANRQIPMITVNTNGIRLAQKAFARRLHAAAPNVLVSISLDAVDVEVNDYHRGTGGAQAKLAIENCTSVGQRVNISCVLTSENIEFAPALLQAYAGKVKNFSFFPRIPRSECEVASQAEAAIFWDKLRKFSDFVAQAYPVDGDVNVMLPFRKLPKDERGGLFNHVQGCCCAYTRVYIDSELHVYPCYYSAGAGNCLGIAQHRNLSDLWGGDSAVRLRERAKQDCLCGLTFGSDKVPYRFLNRDHHERKVVFSRFVGDDGKVRRAELWKRAAQVNKSRA